MTNKEKFSGFDFSQNQYEQEARERWGDEAVNRANAGARKMDEGTQNEIQEIYEKLALLRTKSPASAEAQAAIGEWFNFLNSNFGTYSFDAFKGLGQMYIQDERFTKNIDKMGEGLALFMCEAMTVFADKKGRTE